MLKIISLAIGASLLSTAAYAQVDREPTEIRISTAGVNFHDRAATAAFYQRLRSAARTACDSGFERDLGINMADRQCARQALVGAVRSLNEPMLSLAAGLPTTTTLAENTR